MQPNTYVALFPLVFLYGGLAALYGEFGVLELKGLHRHNIAGSIISTMLLVPLFILQDGHLDTFGLIVLALFCVLPITSLADLRSLSGSRAFASVLSVDSALLILLSVANYYTSSGSNTIRGSPQVQGTVGLLAGTLLLASGVFRVIRPERVSNTSEALMPDGG